MNATSDVLPVEMSVNGIETRGDDWGSQRVRHIDLPGGTDFTPLLVGLPNDLCQCPHWGYVIDGEITLRYADGHQETSRAGEMYYWPAGHTGWTDSGVKFVEISPVNEVRTVMEHIAAKIG